MSTGLGGIILKYNVHILTNRTKHIGRDTKILTGHQNDFCIGRQNTCSGLQQLRTSAQSGYLII